MSQAVVTCVSARVIQNWIDMICDLGHKPHIVVNRNVVISREVWGKAATLTDKTFFDVPMNVEDERGGSVWNVSPTAIGQYHMEFSLGVLCFSVRVRGKSVNLVIPVEHITNVIVPGYNINIESNSLTFASFSNEQFKVSTYGGSHPPPDKVEPVQVDGIDEPTPPTPEKPTKSRAHLTVVK